MDTSTTETATIPNGATESSAVDMVGLTPIALVLPAALTSTTVTFKVSANGTAYSALYDGTGGQVTVSVGTSRAVSLGDILQYFTGWRFLKLVAGSAEGAERTIAVQGVTL